VNSAADYNRAFTVVLIVLVATLALLAFPADDGLRHVGAALAMAAVGLRSTRIRGSSNSPSATSGEATMRRYEVEPQG
jgi:hypothetical protein